MKFSLDWLSDFVDVSGAGGLEKIADSLNEIGLEVGLLEIDKSLGAWKDTILDLDITPNRPDAMNHRGVARDLAAALHLPFDNARIDSKLAGDGAPIEASADVRIEVPERCHRFGARLIRGTRAVPSPEPVRRRFEAIGIKIINGLVDATNRSLWEIGQPMHAYDADKIAGGRLVIRHAAPGEKLLCLDGIDRQLHPDDVVVADEKSAIGLAGVIGGADSAISESTTNVLLEAAWWDPIAVRRTARRHGLHTDASHRFERGADIEAIPEGLALAAKMILESAGGELAKGTIDSYPRRFSPRAVRLRLSRLIALSGLAEFPPDRISEILIRLGFGVAAHHDDLSVTVPSWRPDVSIEEDLIEEVVRIHGYSKIPSMLPPAGTLGKLHYSSGEGAGRAPREIEDLISDQAREAGFFEAMNFPFAAPEGSDLFGNLLETDSFRAEPLLVANPLDSTRPILRRLLLPGLLEAASLNHRNGRKSIALFEIGRVWDKETPTGADPGATESRHMALVLGGLATDESPRRPFDLLDAKGRLSRILEAVGGEPPAFAPENRWVFGSATGLSVSAQGKRIGIVGKLSDSIRRGVGLPSETLVAELDLGILSRGRNEPRFADYSRNPAADVDLTLRFAAGVSWERIESAVRDARLENFEGVTFGSRYSDAGDAKINFQLTFRAADRTLSQEEVNRERDRLIDLLRTKLGGNL